MLILRPSGICRLLVLNISNFKQFSLIFFSFGMFFCIRNSKLAIVETSEWKQHVSCVILYENLSSNCEEIHWLLNYVILNLSVLQSTMGKCYRKLFWGFYSDSLVIVMYATLIVSGHIHGWSKKGVEGGWAAGIGQHVTWTV